MENETSVGPVNACISGLVAGGLLVVIGILAAPPPANELALPRPAIEPVCVLLAAAVAAAVPSYRLRAPLSQTLAVALGAAVFTYILSQWMGHWAGVGAVVRKRPVNWAEVILRRDLGVSALGVLASAFIGTVLGNR